MNQQPDNEYEEILRKEKLQPLNYNQYKSILDVGGGDGNVWEGLDDIEPRLVLIEPDSELAERARSKAIYNAIYDSYSGPAKRGNYDCVTIMGVLEHVDDPVALMEEYSGIKHMYITVPNANSFHRYMGVHLKHINRVTDLHEGDLAIGHKRVFTYTEFEVMVEDFAARHQGYVVKIGTTSFKPFSSSQMIELGDKMIDAFNFVGSQVGMSGEGCTHGAEIYAKISLPVIK
jgi:hypothetical protein